MKLFLGIYTLILIVGIHLVFQEKTLEQSISDGKEIYQDFCVQCHLPKGQGVSGVFPPLNQSDYLMDDIERSIAAVKYGLKGPIRVNGENYNGVMVGQGLYEDEVADVMNYILHSWDNKSTEFITEKRVTAISEN